MTTKTPEWPQRCKTRAHSYKTTPKRQNRLCCLLLIQDFDRAVEVCSYKQQLLTETFTSEYYTLIIAALRWLTRGSVPEHVSGWCRCVKKTTGSERHVSFWHISLPGVLTLRFPPEVSACETTIITSFLTILTSVCKRIWIMQVSNHLAHLFSDAHSFFCHFVWKQISKF